MKKNKKDIENREDIILMVDSFYDKVNENAKLSAVFNDFAKINWDTHLPIMYNFWSTLIFGEKGYKGNPFAKHIPLPVDEKHFSSWIALFIENMDELFEGEVAEATKLRAKSIAQIFQSKLKLMK